MNDYHIYLLRTIIVGWPGETEENSEKTQELIKKLHDQKAKMFYTPILFIPFESTPLGKSKRISLKNPSKIQLNIIENCWEYNGEFWGSKIPNHWLKLIGCGAKGLGLWRRLTRSDTAYISNKFADFLHKIKFPSDPRMCRY